MPRARRDPDSHYRHRPGHNKTTSPLIQKHNPEIPSLTEYGPTAQPNPSLPSANVSSVAIPLILETGHEASLLNNTEKEALAKQILTGSKDIPQKESCLIDDKLNDNGFETKHGIAKNSTSSRPNSGLTTLLSQWKKKSEGSFGLDMSVTVPLWLQTHEKASISKAVAAAQALSVKERGQPCCEEKTKNLRDEITREKASQILLEQLLEDQRRLNQQQQEEFRTLQREHQQVQRQMIQNNNRIIELESTLTTAQQALETHHNSIITTDWVINRQDVSLTDNIIGVGGWGKVLEGRFRRSIVAVKQIHDLILSPHNRRLFEREMHIAARCRHPCLLQFIGATNDNYSPLFVTELLDTSLRRLMDERELQLHETKTIALDVSRALNYLHLNQPTPIIHRDISSANVLLWKHGDIWRGKVSDYGTANFMQYSMTISPGAVVYSAPEAQTSRQSPKVDVYSFGVLLCEMSIREFPDPMTRTEQVSMVTNHMFRDLIRRCLAEIPEERPSMDEIINELES